MDRIQRGMPGLITSYWEQSGEAVDPGPVTITITSSDGTIIANEVTAAGTVDQRILALTADQTTSLDLLTVVWTSVDNGIQTTYAEIVGGFLFSVRQARMRSPLQDTVQYTTESLLFYRTLAEQAIESICGVAFVPRFSIDEALVSRGGLLTLPRRRIRAVRSLSSQGLVQNITSAQILGGSISVPGSWTSFSRPLVAYEHGYDESPYRVSRAALELAKRWIVESPWDERMTAYRDRSGGELDILTASHTNPFDIPEVVAVSEQYGMPMVGVV